MKSIKYIQMIAACLLISCNDFLDVKPVGKMIPKDVAHYENLLNNPFTVNSFMMDNNKGCFYAYMGDNLRISENQAKYLYVSTFPNLDRLAGYVFYEPVMDPTYTPDAWIEGIYRAISYFNTVIKGVDEIDSESEYAKGVIAQAKAARAWIYMNAALAYGPMYDPSGNNVKRVIPYRTDPDPMVSNGPLNTTVEIFGMLKADLDYACANCPLSVGNSSRADRACAYALRAEYHMFMRDWENMLQDAREAWKLALANKGDIEKMIYNYNDFSYEATGPIMPEEGCSPEFYMILKGSDALFTQTSNRENLFYRECAVGSPGYVTTLYPSLDWQSIFDPAKDLRWKLFALTVPGYSTIHGGVEYKDGNQIGYFRDRRMSSTAAVTYPLLLLMKAEAEARTNNLLDALADLNALRRFRYAGTDTDIPFGSSLVQDELLHEILKERRREQPIGSFQRTLDLKRYFYDSGKPWSKTVIVHSIGAKNYNKSITDAFYQSLPIDNAVLNYNPQWGIPVSNAPFAPYKAI